MSKSSIFVGIPSYADYDVPATIDSVFRNSSGRHYIKVAVVEQVTKYTGAWSLGRLLPKYAEIECVETDKELLGVGGARSMLESMYSGQEYQLTIDSHTRFEPDWDAYLVKAIGKLPGPQSLITGWMSQNQWTNNGQIPVLLMNDMRDGLASQYYPQLTPGSREDFYPARQFLACATFGPSWLGKVPYDPHIMFYGEEPTMMARLWTAGFDLYHGWMPIMHGAIHPPGRPWDRNEWFEKAAVSLRRCRHLMGVELCEAGDIALTELHKYGMGTKRSFEDFQEWSGFNYKTGTVKEEWGFHEALKGVSPARPSPPRGSGPHLETDESPCPGGGA